ncbi:MAG TPA: type II secretion system F family protein [Candidatus Paceibacterota bacterium]|nr:type II secretion system F family protein [Candidatus Paceibacterota bacterium]
MLFHYVAADEAGKMEEGEHEADTLADVLRFLGGKQLRPVSVKPMQKVKVGFFKSFFGGINTSDKVFLTKYLALMLRVGTDLLSAINILILDFDKPSMRNFLLEVRDDLSKGQPFYMSFARHPKEFSPTVINLIKAAEASGTLQKTFEDLSVSLEKEAEIRSKVRSAMIYPIVLVCIATGILTFLVTFALPKVANVFSQSGINPPWFSQIVFTVGLFLGANIFIILPGVVILVAVLVWVSTKTNAGKKVASRVLTQLPLVRTVYHEIAVQRMASTMSSLMKAGLPIVQTIEIAAETVGLDSYRSALLRIANEGLSKGLTIGEAFRRETVFPKMVSNLVAISEKAGHLEEVLDTLAQFYESNIDGNIKALVSLLEPAMLLVMGVMVGVIALSIIVPIYQLTTSF